MQRTRKGWKIRQNDGWEKNRFEAVFVAGRGEEEGFGQRRGGTAGDYRGVVAARQMKMLKEVNDDDVGCLNQAKEGGKATSPGGGVRQKARSWKVVDPRGELTLRKGGVGVFSKGVSCGLGILVVTGSPK